MANGVIQISIYRLAILLLIIIYSDADSKDTGKYSVVSVNWGEYINC